MKKEERRPWRWEGRGSQNGSKLFSKTRRHGKNDSQAALTSIINTINKTNSNIISYDAVEYTS